MRKKKVVSIVIVGILASVVIYGCSLGNTQVIVSSGFSDNEVFQINDEVCTMSEARVFLTNYQNIYATMYGINLWNHSFSNDELEEYVKDITISQLAQILAMDFLAEKKEITLTEEEKTKTKKAAEEYYDSLNKTEKEYMSVSQGDIERLYGRYGLANKLYTHLTGDVNVEVSDDEARIMEAMQIFVTDKEAVRNIEKELKNGADFKSLANLYNEAEEAEVSFGRSDVPPEVEKAAFSLVPEEISKKIKTEGGWYFIQCLNNYNQELTDANKATILQKRREEAFDDVYKEYLSELSSKFNEKVWKKVKIEIGKDITTDSFFKVYEKHCKW